MLRKVLMILLLLAVPVSAQHLSQDSLISRVRQETRILGDTAVVSNTIIAHFLVTGLYETDQRLRPYLKWDTVTTVQGVQDYALNSDCYDNGVKSAKVRQLDSIPVAYVSLKEIMADEIGHNFESSAPQIPLYYVQSNLSISLDPVPQETLSVVIRYEAVVAPWDSLGDTLVGFPSYYEPLLVDYATFEVRKRQGLLGQASAIEQKWKADVAEVYALRQVRKDALASPEATQ